MASKESAAPANFRLFDVFRRVAELEHQSYWEHQRAREHDLCQSFETQLRAVLKEHLGIPHHSDANEISLEQLRSDILKIVHRNYQQYDLKEQTALAVEQGRGAERRRHELEHQQVLKLYQALEEELETLRFSDSSFLPSSAKMLSHEVRKAYGLTEDEPVFVGQKYAAALPINTDVYPEGKAFLNLYQAVYVPGKKKLLLLMDQYFAELDNSLLAQILNDWQPGVVPEHPTEEVLLTVITTLPHEIRTDPVFAVIEAIAKKYQSVESVALRQEQQSVYGAVRKSQENLEAGAAFLTHVIVTEYERCLAQPKLLGTLSHRLNFAFEMVAHPLLSLRAFSYVDALRVYRETYWQQSAVGRKHPEKLLRQLQEQSFLQAARYGQPDKKSRELREKAAGMYVQKYGSFATSLYSKASCAVGSVGGLNKVMEMTRSPLGQAVMGGYNPSFAELQQLIGDRAKDWKIGECVNPHCIHRVNGAWVRNDVYVGECSLCSACELLHSAGKFGEHSSDGRALHTDRYRDRVFQDGQKVIEELWESCVAVTDLMPGLIGPERVFFRTFHREATASR